MSPDIGPRARSRDDVPISAREGSADAEGAGRPAWRGIIEVSLLLGALLAVLVTAFAWPATRSDVHDIPLAVAGPAPAVEEVTVRLEHARPGDFCIVALPDGDAARSAIVEREVYGAVVVDPAARPAATVLTASAASPAVAQALGQLAVALATGGPDAPAGPVVEDVVPAATDDPRGAGLAAAALPVVLGGIIGAVAVRERVRGARARLVAAAVAALAGGFAATAVLQGWLGALVGDYWLNASVVSLAVGAVALALLGLAELLGMVGLALGAATVMLLGNPLSGLTSAPEMLPAGWGALGQLLPPGAGGQALRSVAFFDGAAAAGPLWVLAAWAVGGTALLLIGAMVRRRG